jgi:hypothetical protein
MTQVTSDWKDRAQSLLEAVRDVAPPGHPPGGAAGSAQHRALFEQYLKKLGRAKRSADQWWLGLIDTEVKHTRNRDRAIANVKERRPIGPVSHPEVTGTVRKFWLACAALNEEVAIAERVAPEDFILGWMLRLGHDDLAKFLSGYPFWPVGMDWDGNWI